MGFEPEDKRPFTYCVLNSPNAVTPRTARDGVDRAHFSGVRRVNLIVGPNNSGKSQIMRAACTRLGGGGGLYGRNFSGLRETQASKEGIALLAGPEGELSVRCAELLALKPEHDGEAALLFEELRMLMFPDDRGKLARVLGDLGATMDRVRDMPINAPRRRCYLPTLRSVRASSNEAAMEAEWGLGPGVLFSGATLIGELQVALGQSRESRDSVRAFEKYLGDTFFGGARVSLSPGTANGPKLDIEIGHEKARPFYQLGDGIQQIAIMTWPLFRWRDDDLVLFIEEPELCLHPGLQRAVLHSFLGEPTGKGTRTIFLATHSNHLVDAALELGPDDVAIFRVRKRKPEEEKSERYEPQFVLTATSHRDPETLRSLGVRPSSVLLANATIWVEGISDRMYLRHWLKLYGETKDGKRFTEDLHFTFIEYGGANRVHYEFVPGEKDASGKAITPESVAFNWFLVLDSDAANVAKKKGKRIQGLRDSVPADRIHITSSREMENLIAAPTLKKWMRANWKPESTVDPSFAQTDYTSKYLGKYLVEQGQLTWSSAPGWNCEGKTGTISDKTRFAREICEQGETFADLSEEAQTLVEKLAEFIDKSNPR